MAEIFCIPEVAKHIPAGLGPVLRSVPTTQRLNCYLHPWHLDLSEGAKYGATGKYPSMVQVRTHLPSIVWKTYQSEREALDIKFDMPPGDDIEYFTVKFIDGHCKSVICQAVLALVIHMQTQVPR